MWQSGGRAATSIAEKNGLWLECQEALYSELGAIVVEALQNTYSTNLQYKLGIVRIGKRDAERKSVLRDISRSHNFRNGLPEMGRGVEHRWNAS